VVLESDNGVARVRWRRAITGEHRYLAIGQGRTTLDVLGDRALLTQDTRALVVDLARGVLTHNIQRVRVRHVPTAISRRREMVSKRRRA